MNNVSSSSSFFQPCEPFGRIGMATLASAAASFASASAFALASAAAAATVSSVSQDSFNVSFVVFGLKYSPSLILIRHPFVPACLVDGLQPVSDPLS